MAVMGALKNNSSVKVNNSTQAPMGASKTAYQQFFSDPVQPKWKLGDKPTTYGQALATINNMANTDPKKAQEKLALLNQYRTQPGSVWYDPYAAATNSAVANLKSYGIDPAELTADWFNQNTSWQAYLSYRGTTTTPSTPLKNASDQEKLAYDLYQYQKSLAATDAAKAEWAAAQDELKYWANRKDLNLSDDEIINKVFGGNKYSTLKKMDDSRVTGAPLELNDAIDYNSDSVRGVIWAARNGGGSGNLRQDIANYYSGFGNNWIVNEETAAKLNKSDLSTYSPHEVGMTGKDMDDVGAYFGVSSFAPGDIDALRKKVDWNDATSVKMFQKAAEAEETTLKAEKELEELNKAFEKRLNGAGFKDQAAADKWIDEHLKDYPTLSKMDSGLLKGDPVNMTRAVPYRKQMFQQKAAEAIANPKKTGADILDETGTPVSDADKATTKVQNENVTDAVDAMAKYLTTGETEYFDSVPGVEYDAITEALSGTAKDDIQQNAGWQYVKTNGEYTNTVLSAVPTVKQYEKYQSAYANLEANIKAFEEANEKRVLANEDIQSEKIVENDDVYVELYMGTDGKYTVNENTERMLADAAYDELRKKNPNITWEECFREIQAADQKVCDEENARVEAIRNARAETGEMGLDSPEDIAQYEKDKETLQTLDAWLNTNKKRYDDAIKSVEDMKAKRDAIGQIAARNAGVEYDPSESDYLIQVAASFYDYQPPEVDGNSLIDEIHQDNVGYDQVNEAIEENIAVIKDMQFVMRMLGDNIPDDLKRNMEAAIGDAERQNRVYNAYLVTNDPKFKELAEAGRDETIDMSDISDVKIGNTQKNWFPLMTDEEKDIYFALAARDGVDAADQFYTDLRDDLQERMSVGIENVTRKAAESGWLGRLVSEALAILPAGINALAGGVYAAGVAFGADPEEANILKVGSHLSQSQHNANINEINNIYAEKNPALAKIFTGIYEIMYNRGNSLVTGKMLGGFMPKILKEGKVADFINNIFSATPIAISAASDALEDAINRGANSWQQAIIFTSTLMAESWTEGIEFGHIEAAGKKLLTKEGITSFLKEYIPNAMSEVVGESANDLIENAADYWVKYINNPEYKTQHDNAVADYMAKDETLTPEQAEALVHQDEVAGVLHTAIISFFSPGADIVSMTGNTMVTYGAYALEARNYNKNATGKHAKQKSVRDIRLEHEAAEAARAEAEAKAAEEAKNPPAQPVTEEQTTEAPVQTEAQTEQYPVNGPAESQRRSFAQAMTAYDSGIIMLEEAAGANSTTQAAAVASVINVNDIFSAEAAAAKLNPGMVQAVMIAGMQMNLNKDTLSMGLQFAALGGGECASILNNGVANGLSATEIAGQLAAAAANDAKNEAVLQGVAAGVHSARVNEEFKKLMAKSEAEPAIEAQQKIDEAKEATKAAEDEFNQKQNELEAARQGVSEAAAAVNADPVNDGNQMTAALSRMTSAAAVAREYQQKLDNAKKNQQTVEAENGKTIETVTAYMRQQAEATVAEQEAVEAQAKAEAEAQAQAEAEEQRTENNTTVLSAEDFINQTFPNATEADKQKIREAFARISREKKANAKTAKTNENASVDDIKARKQFVKAISKKFGVDIEIGDTTFGGTRAYKNAQIDTSTGKILIDTNATQDDIMYAVLAHELTHIAEKSGTYKELASSILQLIYNDDSITYDGVLKQFKDGTLRSQIAADLIVKKNTYDTVLTKEGKKGDYSPEYILQEIVADGMGSMFFNENGEVDQDLLNRFVAEKPSVARRVLASIKSFLKKMAGIEGAPITQAQRIVDMMETALKEGTQKLNQNANGDNAVENRDESWRSIDVTDKAWQQKNIEAFNREEKAKERMLDDIIAKNGWTVKEGTWGNMSDDFSTHREVFDKNGRSLGIYGNSDIYGVNGEQAKQALESAGLVANKRGHYSAPIQNNDIRHSIPAVPIVTDNNGNELAVELPGGTVAVDTERYSLNSFNPDERERVREALLSAEDENGNKRFTKEEVDQYLTDAMGIASMIAADRTRLDFEADKDQVFLKKNQDYYYTLDASTLCAKRLLYQGTFNAIQRMMPNEALMPDDLIDLVNIMREMGYETPCGICYVESRRRWLDKYAQEWLDSFEGIEGEPMPTLADLTTSDGLSEMNVPGSPKYAPNTRQAFIDAMNAKGSANPKVVQLRTEYNGDIRKLSEADIQKVKDIGGLRIQSFSDFETPHLLDMIQAVYDMAAVGLTSQAYTKVPNFAWVFGDTGIKINLSLIGKGTGLDADGNLVFDNVEGMNFDQAMSLRDRYSKNVGTILVGINDEHIIAAMGDPRIDFIIPFHKSGWSHGELSRIPVLNSYLDYTATQNEQIITGENIVQEKGKGQKAVENWIAKNGEKYPNYKIIDEGNGKFTIEYRDGYTSESFAKHKERTGEKLSNFEPVGANQYWNFDESGEWNARKYLQMCAEAKRLPKFYQFLVDNGDGTFSLPEGNDKRSTAIREGYWKTLIDFKMYENDAYGRTKEDGTRTEVKGSRQTEVTPNVNMNQAVRVMNEHKLGRQMPNKADGTAGPFIPMESNNALPTAEPAAEEFAEFLKYKRQRQEELTKDRLAKNPKKESDDARNKRIAREGAEIYQTYYGANAFGDSSNIPLMNQTYESGTEEPVQSMQNRMAIDPETGETVRYSLPDADTLARMDIDQLNRMLESMTIEELESLWDSDSSENATETETVRTTQAAKPLPVDDDTYRAAVERGDTAEAQRIVDEKAKEAGYILKALHRTDAEFTKFDKRKQSGKRGKTLGNAFYVSSPKGLYNEYDDVAYGKNRMSLYVKPGNVLNIQEGLSKKEANKVYNKYFKPFVNDSYGTYKAHVVEKLQNGFRVIDYIDEAAQKNNTTTDEIFKWLGYNSIKDGPQYAIFDPEQIKSADPITYDDQGNVIPPSERFNPKEEDIRYSLPSDAPYLAAVERGEMEDAEDYIREYASERGYTDEAYHGTQAFGFTEFDMYKSQDEIFVAYNPNTSRSYTNDAPVRNIGDPTPVPVYEMTNKEIAERLKSIDDLKYYGGYVVDINPTTQEDVQVAVNDVFSDVINLLRGKEWGDISTDAFGEGDDVKEKFVLEAASKTTIPEEEWNKCNNPQEMAEMYIGYAIDRVQNDWYGTNSQYPLLDNLLTYYNYSNVPSSLFFRLVNLDDDMDIAYREHFFGSTDNYFHLQVMTSDGMRDLYKPKGDIASWLDRIQKEGIYHLLTRPGKQLVVDADYSNWNRIPSYHILAALGYDSEWDGSSYGDYLLTREVADVARKYGYDSVRINNVYDHGGVSGNRETSLGDIGIFFNQQDVKSADTVTYDYKGAIIPPSERFGRSNDLRYSIPSPNVLDDQIRYYLSAPLEGQKGPSSSTAGTAERQFGAGMLQESEVGTFAKEVVREYGRYFPDTNEDQIKRAVAWVRSNKLTPNSDGLIESMQKVSDNKFDYRSADGQARMVAMMAIAVAKNDVAAQTVLADAFNRQGTDLGRALQSRKLFRMMTPAGRIATIDKMLKDEQDRLAKKGTNIDLTFSKWVYMAAAAAKQEGDWTKVRRMAAEELAAQIPANWKDRIRSLRMLSMLANPRTHIRNLVGNALFVPVVSIKNKMAAAMELAKPQGERTKTLRLRVDDDIRNFAKQDAITVRDDLTGDSRWNERDMIRREQKLFAGAFAWLQKLSDFNSNLLEKEDWKFLKGHYTRALGGWIQANGYSVEQMQNNPALLEKARAYAIQEAQKATYRDFNAVANKLNQLSRNGGAVGFVVDAALPFKKTPANILRRGIEYSPIGIAKSTYTYLTHLKKGDITVNQFIDGLCSGLTGTGVMAIGALLASLGIVTVGMDDDDDRFEKERGGQEYALNISKLLRSFGVKIDGEDVTYTVDWAAPVSMPFFVGAAVMHQLQEEKDGYTFEDFLNDSSSIAEPVFNLSMLEGVNSLFETSKNEETNSLTQIGAKILSNYATSYVPSLLGGITRTFDPVRRKSFVKSGESGGPMGTFRYAWEQTENKIPGLSQTNIPYRNAFGETDDSSLFEKLIENFISPGYISTTRNEPVIDELERLYNSSDVSDEKKSALVPKLPNKTVGKQALEAEQYDAVTVQRGETAKQLMSDLMNTEYYQNAADEDRASMMADVWTYATQTAQNATVGRKLETWVMNSRTNPVQGIINRSKDTVKRETQDGWKAEAVLAAKARDYEALDVCIEKLKEIGVKDAKSSVKSAIASEYKQAYITAYQRNDKEAMLEIEDILEYTDLFKETDFDRWLDDMNDQIIEEEEE